MVVLLMLTPEGFRRFNEETYTMPKLVAYVCQRIRETTTDAATPEAVKTAIKAMADDFTASKPGRSAVVTEDGAQFFYSTGHPAGGVFLRNEATTDATEELGDQMNPFDKVASNAPPKGAKLN
jgi:hypothetical protein